MLEVRNVIPAVSKYSATQISDHFQIRHSRMFLAGIQNFPKELDSRQEHAGMTNKLFRTLIYVALYLVALRFFGSSTLSPSAKTLRPSLLTLRLFDFVTF
jgi:hypothetical protein